MARPKLPISLTERMTASAERLLLRFRKFWHDVADMTLSKSTEHFLTKANGMV